MTDEPTTDAGTMPDALPAIPLNWPEAGPRPHPFASVFRMLSGEEKQALDADIAAHDLRETIKMFEGMILDGRNRYLGLVDNGDFDPEVDAWQDSDWFEVFHGTREEALDYVWSLNEQRRHDNATQRAAAAARFANLRTVTLAEAAEKFGVSARQVSSAQKVIEEGVPELVEAMDAGRVPAYLAEKATDLDPDDQREIAAAPKGEASALAREKLQDPPARPADPVVKPLEPSMLAMFAAAVLEFGRADKVIDLASLDALAREHGLLADRDRTFNLNRPTVLAFDLARKKLGIGNDDLVGESLYAVLSAELSDDIELLKADYRQALSRFDAALVRGAKEVAGDLKLMMEAILWHANGKTRSSIAVNERPVSIRQSAAPAPGSVPMWGQSGAFAIEVEGLSAIVRLEASYFGGPRLEYHPVRFDARWPGGSWFSASVRYDEVDGSVTALAERFLAEAVARHTAKIKQHSSDDRVGMFFPERVYRLGEAGDIVRVERGVELVGGQWPEAVSALEAGARQMANLWRHGGSPTGGKKRWPKPVHLATHVFSIGSDHLVPLPDFPENGAYLKENNGTWRYVDDGTDPGADAVTARLAGLGAIPDRAAYEAALAALTEPRGKLHQSTAADVLRAGVAANVPRQQMADDLGHPIGTIKTWTSRLELTDPARLRDPDPALAARNRAKAATDALEAAE